MQVNQFFIIGNTTLPSSWVALLLAFAITFVIIRFRFGKRISGMLMDSMFYFILVWKLSVILTDFTNVIKSPLSIIYFNGGQIGFYLGLIAGLLSIVIELKKNGLHKFEKLALFLGYVTIQSVFQLAMVLLNEGPMTAKYVTMIMFTLILLLFWTYTPKVENDFNQFALLFATSHFFTMLFQPSSYINDSFFTTIIVTVFVIFLGQNEKINRRDKVE